MRTCPDCHTIAEENANYCENCGCRLQPERAIPPPFSEEPLSPSSDGGVGPQASQAAYPPGTASSGGCLECGHVNIPEEEFCLNCGALLVPVTGEGQLPPTPGQPAPDAAPEAAPLSPDESVQSRTGTSTCSACGCVNPTGERFCLNCGIQLDDMGMIPPPLTGQSPAPSEAPPPPPVHEAKAGAVSSICFDCSFANPPGERYCLNCGILLYSAREDFIPTLDQDQTATSLKPRTPPQGALQVGHPRVETITGRFIVEGNSNVLLPPGKTEITIGRSDPGRNIYPDVDLTPYGGQSGGVSRLHARLVWDDGQVFIEDSFSTNSTLLNKKRLKPGSRYPLRDGDEICFGQVVLNYSTR